ncbi:hypothetical protein ACFLT1_07835, partial [Bacteroidota bacterium]
QLALHEGRHAFQVSKLNQGLSRGLSYVLGEQAIGAITGLLPMWYLEGDAVDAETRFSYFGRGRQPSFEMEMRAILLEREKGYSFAKSVLGSYKDKVPNHYQTGYLLVKYGREKYGNDFWTDMEDLTAKRPFLLNPGYFNMRKYGISSKKAYYKEAMATYKSLWSPETIDSSYSSLKQWNRNAKNYTSYHFPQWVNDSLIVALKKGLDQIPEFVLVDDSGKEKRIFRPGFMNSGRFSYAEGKLVWDEWIPDIRWSNRNYSVIKIYDLATGELHSPLNKTRYYSPSFSKSGQNIALIEQSTDHTFSLVIIDLEGKVLIKVRHPGNYYLQHPGWMEQDSAIMLTLVKEDGEYLYSYSLDSGKWEELFHAGKADISYPVESAGAIYFGSTHTGTDNIFRYSLASKQLQQVTSAEFGAFEPSLSSSSDQLTYADYHGSGYRAVSLNLAEVTESTSGTTNSLHGSNILASTPEEVEIIENSGNIEKGKYTPRPYRKLLHSLNIHSWAPYYFDYMNPESALHPDDLPVQLGFSVLSQNLLSTVIGMAGYEYRNSTHYLHSGVRLKGRYPVVDISLQYGGEPLIDKINNTDEITLDPNRMVFLAHTYIPFRLNTGKYISIFQPFFGYRYTSDILPNSSRSAYVSGIHYMHYRLYYSSYLRMGLRDIFPRLGISVYTGFRNAPFNGYNFGNLKYGGAYIYLPGILKHQSLRIHLATQTQEIKNYFISNSISMPRGIHGIRGLNLNLLSADYTFPILYPDLDIDPFLYVKRIRAALWSDMLIGRDVYIENPDPQLTDKNFLSLGGDLLFDVHMLRFYFPFSIGVRISYLPENSDVVPELLFNVDLNN